MPVSCQPACTQHAFLPAGPAYTSDCTSAATTHTVHALSVEPGPTQSVPIGLAPTQPAPTMNECTHSMPKPTWPVHTMSDHALTTPRPTVPGLVECTHTVSMPGLTGPTTSDPTVPMHVMPQPTVPGPTSPEGKPQPDTSSLVVHPSTPPAPAVTQPQVVLIKQFQQPKPYTGASSWKGYREYFERLAAVNGWATAEQKVEQLALALEGPATEVLRGLDTSQPQAYNIIWEALARRFGSLDGTREAMRRFDSRRQEDSETTPDFEQALRTLHREAWPTATPEQRDAALKRRFEDGLLSTEMIQFLRLHARDLDFQATVVKARQFADATGQSKPKKRVNFIDNRPRSPAQPEWEPLLQGFRDMMAEAIQPLQRALRSQDQGSAPRSTAPTPLSGAMPRHSLTHRRVGPGRISRSVMAKGLGQVMPTSLLEHHGHSPSLGVEVVLMADHERHPTSSGISDSFSNALSPRLGLFVNVVDAMSVVP